MLFLNPAAKKCRILFIAFLGDIRLLIAKTLLFWRMGGKMLLSFLIAWNTLQKLTQRMKSWRLSINGLRTPRWTDGSTRHEFYHHFTIHFALRSLFSELASLQAAPAKKSLQMLVCNMHSFPQKCMFYPGFSNSRMFIQRFSLARQYRLETSGVAWMINNYRHFSIWSCGK